METGLPEATGEVPEFPIVTLERETPDFSSQREKTRDSHLIVMR